MCTSHLISPFAGIGTGIGTETMIGTMQGDEKEIGIGIVTAIGTETGTGTATGSEMKGIMAVRGIEIENGKVGIGIEGTETVVVEEAAQEAEAGAGIAGNETETMVTSARDVLVAALVHIGDQKMTTILGRNNQRRRRKRRRRRVTVLTILIQRLPKPTGFEPLSVWHR